MKSLSHLDDMLSKFRVHFKHNNFTHFRNFILGLINNPYARATVSNVYQSGVKSKSYWAQLKFLSRGKWCVDKVSAFLTQRVQTIYGKGVYVYDETHAIKTGRKQYGLHLFRNAAYNARNNNQSKFHHGHQFGALGWLCKTPMGTRIFPLCVRVMCPNTKDTSLSVLKQICATVPPGLIVFDRGFNRRKVFEAVLSQGHHLLCRAKSNAVFYQIPATPKKQKRGSPLRYGNRINLSRLQFDNIKIDNKTHSIADKVVRTKMCAEDVRLVVIRTRPKKNKPYRYFCMFTSDLACPVTDIVRHYQNRWQIETTFRDVKQHFGFDAYQLKQRNTLNRFVQLSFVAACLTQLLFTEISQIPATDTPMQAENQSLEVEAVLRTLGIHWYKPKYITRGLMVAYLQKQIQQQGFSTSYDLIQNSQKNTKIRENST